MDVVSTTEPRPASARIVDVVVANLLTLGAVALTLVLVGAAFYD